MVRWVFRNSLICLLLGFLLISCTRHDKHVADAVAQASQLVQQAQETEKVSYTAAVKLYTAAVDKITAVVKNSTPTQTTQRLQQGELKIGPYTLTELQGIVLIQAKEKAEAEQSLLANALLLARVVQALAGPPPLYSGPTAKIEVLGNVAQAYGSRQQTQQVIEILNSVTPSEREELIRKLVGNYLEAQQYEAAVQLITTSGQITDQDSLLQSVAHATISGKRYDLALQVASLVADAKMTGELLARLTIGYAENGEQAKALKLSSQAFTLINTITDTCEKMKTLEAVQRSYIEANLLDQAQQIIDAVDHRLLRADMLAKIAPRHLAAHRENRAEEAIAAIDDTLTQYKGLIALALAWIESGNRTKAAAIIPRVQQLLATIDTTTLQARQRESEQLSCGISLTPIFLGDVTYFQDIAKLEIADLYARMGDQANAVALLNQTQSPLEEIGPYVAIPLMAALVEIYFATHQLERAETTVKAMSDIPEKAAFLERLAYWYVQVGQYDKALEIAQRVENSRFEYRPFTTPLLWTIFTNYKQKKEPSLPQYVLDAIVGLAKRYAEAGDEQSALTIANALIESPQQEIIYALAGKYSAEGQYSQVLRLSTTITNREVATSLKVDLINRYIEANRPDRALEILALVPDAGSDDMKASTASAYMRVGDFTRALQVTKTIIDPLARFRSFDSLVEQAIKGGQKDVATGILVLAEQVAETLSPTGICGMCSFFAIPIKYWALTKVAALYTSLGQKDRATQILTQVLAVAENAQPPFDRLSFLGSLTDRFANAGQPDHVRHIHAILEKEPASTPTVSTFRSITLANAYGVAGQGEKAAEILSQVATEANSIEQLTAVYLAYKQSGQLQKATKVLSRLQQITTGLPPSEVPEAINQLFRAGADDLALQLAKSISEPEFRTLELTELAEQVALTGPDERKMIVFKEVLSALPATNTSAKASITYAMARAFAESGRYEEALRLAQTQDAPDHKAVILSFVAFSYVRVGNLEEAQKLARALDALSGKMDFSGDTWTRIAHSYAIAGQEDKAEEIFAHVKQQRAAYMASQQPSNEDEESQQLLSEAYKHLEAGRYDQALETAKRHSTIDFLTALALAYVNAGQDVQALATADVARQHGFSQLYAHLAHIHVESGSQEKMHKVLSHLLSLVQKNPSVSDKEKGYTALAQTLATVDAIYTKTGQPIDNRTKQLLHDIVASISAWTWNALATEMQTGEKNRPSHPSKLSGYN